MIGYDFKIFWDIGQALLAGQNPYSIPFSVYPPAANYLFTIFALAPFNISYGIWTGLNLILFQRSIVRIQKSWRGFAWLGFTPVLFVFLTGQIDILFLWLSGFLVTNGWTAVAAGVLITLKPQIALIVLPWYLLQWIFHQRPQFLRWLGGTLILHALPLIVDPTIYQKWLAVVSREPDRRLAFGSGVFALTNLNIPLALIGILAAVIVVFGLTRDAMFSKAAQQLALPSILWYENVLLIGSTPWWLLVPVSWVAFIAGTQVHSNYPFFIIPLASLLWQWFGKVGKKETATPEKALQSSV